MIDFEVGNIYFLVAAIFMFLGAWAHFFMGGKEIARPLLECNLEEKPKSLAYYCWHLVSIELVVIAGIYTYLAFAKVPEIVLSIAVIFISFTASLLHVGVALKFKTHMFKETPQWLLFAIVSALGMVGFIV